VRQALEAPAPDEPKSDDEDDALRAVRQALEAPAPDRSKGMHRLIGACVRAGLDVAAIHAIVASYPPAVDKYGPGDRLHVEVDRSLRKIGAPW
jgi:hypothetical protein